MEKDEDRGQCELSALLRGVGEGLKDQFHEKFLKVVGDLGLLLENGPLVPVEVWTGAAQAIADASGCRVILQSHLVETHTDNRDIGKTVGFREIAVLDPLLWIRE
jgi:hypothetical protein